MLSKLRQAVLTAVSGANEASDATAPPSYRHVYSRPAFLNFTYEEVTAASDCRVRPLILPRDVEFPFDAGYCECINAGKSLQNEDQAAVWQGTIADDIKYTAFAIFDGHGGPLVAVAAAKEMEHLIKSKLENVAGILSPRSEENSKEVVHERNGMRFQIDLKKPVSAEQLIVGALETAFREFDARIGNDKETYKVRGGCTSLVALFILGKVFVACAGDSRAIVSVGDRVAALSRDHTPTSERARICNVGTLKPTLLNSLFTTNLYQKRLTVQDLGRQVLYCDPEGYGYSYRTIESEDLNKIPLIAGIGKRARLLGTIGVTRGFGDHELNALGTSVAIKPFLSAAPEIRILDVRQLTLGNSDVIIMGSDGLFDVTTNGKAAVVVRASLAKMASDSRKYVCAAQDLVNYARGKPLGRSWKQANGAPASGDDITAWVIPLLPFQLEFQSWLCSHPSELEESNNFHFRDSTDRLPIVLVDDTSLCDCDPEESDLLEPL